jgi:hypothetical protein
MFVLDDLVLLPLQPVLLVAEKIDEMIQEEFYDTDRIKENLMQLQMNFDMGRISQEEFQRQEADLLERLEYVISEREP